MEEERGTLYEEALLLAISKNLEDISRLLQRIREVEGIREKIRSSEQALALLADVRDQLRTLELERKRGGDLPIP